MNAAIKRLINHEQLTKADAREVLIDISAGNYNPSMIAVLLSVFMMRHITVEELEGFRDALLELCRPVDLGGIETIDLCGTGGDSSNTFNISTLAAFVVAGSGISVSKHGNYGVSSVSGSSNVLEAVGLKFTDSQDILRRSIDEAGICFLHAPLFHPAMKNVAPVRRELGVKTFFNMLGPMINPAFPKNQMVGVYDLEILRIYAYLYQKGEKRFTILHSLSGHDEVSLTAKCRYVSNSGEGEFSPEDISLFAVSDADLVGGDTIAEAAEIFTRIISGNGTDAQNAVVYANAGIAIATAKEISFADGVTIAAEALKSGRADQALKKLLKISDEYIR